MSLFCGIRAYVFQGSAIAPRSSLSNKMAFVNLKATTQPLNKSEKEVIFFREQRSKILEELFVVLVLLVVESSSKNVTKVTKNVREQKMSQREQKMFGKEN